MYVVQADQSNWCLLRIHVAAATTLNAYRSEKQKKKTIRTKSETDLQWIHSVQKKLDFKLKIGRKKWWSNWIGVAHFENYIKARTESTLIKFESMSTDHNDDKSYRSVRVDFWTDDTEIKPMPNLSSVFAYFDYLFFFFHQLLNRTERSVNQN